MTNQTALQWFISEFNKSNYTNIKGLIDQAIEMERNMIIDAWDSGNIVGLNDNYFTRFKNGEEYYQTKFCVNEEV